MYAKGRSLQTVAVGGHSKSATRRGAALYCDSGEITFPAIANASKPSPAPMSRVAVLRLGSLSGTQTISASPTNDTLQFRFNGTALELLRQNTAVLATSNTGIAANTDVVVGASIVFATRAAFYVDGVPWGAPTVTGTLNAVGDLNLLTQRTGLERGTFGLLAHYEYERELSAFEHAMLGINPWLFWVPRRSLLKVTTGVATGPTLSLPGVQDITATSARPKVTVTFS